MTTKMLKIKQVRSTAGRKPNHRKSVLGLGLRRIGHSVMVQDTPENRGLINHVGFLIQVEEN